MVAAVRLPGRRGMMRAVGPLPPRFDWRHVVNPPVIVASLGYLVDIYDLILFSVVRVPSLRSLGLEGEALTQQGALLLNAQMLGMLLGGILWGVLGDRRGRLQVLFASILLYSIANAANGAVDSLWAYAVWRFIAGVGLAGELGAGITLVSESLPTHARGWGTTVIATVGVSGALLAVFVAEHFTWRNAYYIGGGLGIALLFLRVGVAESGMFARLRTSAARRGDFLALFQRGRVGRFLWCIASGLPIWFAVAILITFSPEFGRALGVGAPVSAARAVLYFYIGLIGGDFTSGLLSQLVRSRMRVITAFVALSAVAVVLTLAVHGLPVELFYAECALLGVGSGYWAVLVTVGAEQFGTNLRATAATTIPNFVRGAAVPITQSFLALKAPLGAVGSGAVVGGVTFVLAGLALATLEDTFGRDLDYLES